MARIHFNFGAGYSAVLGLARLGAEIRQHCNYHLHIIIPGCRRREESRKDIFVKVGQSLKLENSVHGELGVLSPRTPGMARYVAQYSRVGGVLVTQYLALSRVSICGARRGLAR